jgi:hypothetical protein
VIAVVNDLYDNKFQVGTQLYTLAVCTGKEGRREGRWEGGSNSGGKGVWKECWVGGRKGLGLGRRKWERDQ